MKDVIGGIVFSGETPLRPWDGDPECYVMQISGRIERSQDESDDYEAVGEIKLDLIRLAAALNEDVPWDFVFDAFSLNEVQTALFRGTEFKEELQINAVQLDLLVIKSLEIHKPYQGTNVAGQAIDTSIAILCPLGVTVAPADVLSPSQAKQLRFRRVPGTDVLFRDNG